MHLAANAKLFDKVEIRLTVFACDVLEVALALSNQLQQTTACSKILFVDLEVLSKLLDAFGHNADLYSWATSVSFVTLQCFGNCFLLLTCNHIRRILSHHRC